MKLSEFIEKLQAIEAQGCEDFTVMAFDGFAGRWQPIQGYYISWDRKAVDMETGED